MKPDIVLCFFFPSLSLSLPPQKNRVKLVRMYWLACRLKVVRWMNFMIVPTILDTITWW